MVCTVIVCQADDHQLVPGQAARSLRSVSLAGMDIHLATYPNSRNRWGYRDDEWIEGIVAGVLSAATQDDMILIADHDTVERFSGDVRVVRAIYTLGEPEIGQAIELALASDSEAAIEALAWFWDRGLELPKQGLQTLSEVLETGRAVERRWADIRSKRQIKHALNWLVVLDPRFGDDHDLQALRSLLAGQDPVRLDDDRRVQRWLEAVKEPDLRLLTRYCMTHGIGHA